MSMRNEDQDVQSSPHRESISAFMDGELGAAECESLMLKARHDPETCSEWSLYHCIGDVLRSDDMACHSAAITGRVFARLEEEPHLFVPAAARALESTESIQVPRKRLVGVVAAGFAALLVFGTVMFPQWGPSQGDQMAEQSTTPLTLASRDALPANTVVSPEPVQPLSAEYLVAHRQYSSGIAMRGVVSHVRTAGYEGK